MRLPRIFVTLLLALAPALIGVSNVGGQEGKPIPDDELSRFLGHVPTDQFTWHVVGGPDFTVYHGKANPPLAGSVGFYIGGSPQDLERTQTTLRSRLGRFSVKWHRRVAADGSIHQETVVVLDRVIGLKAHVWAEAPSESQLDGLLSVVGQLPTFSSDELPSRFQELHALIAEEQRLRRLTWVCWSAVVLAGAWFVDRLCRRRQVSAAARLMILAGVIGFSIAATIGGVVLLPAFAMDWFHQANVLLLLTAAGAVFFIVLLLATGLFLVRLVRSRRRPSPGE